MPILKKGIKVTGVAIPSRMLSVKKKISNYIFIKLLILVIYTYKHILKIQLYLDYI